MIPFDLPIRLSPDFFRLMMIQLLRQKDRQTVLFYLIFHSALPFLSMMSPLPL